jgi:hypothetical protein
MALKIKKVCGRTLFYISLLIPAVQIASCRSGSNDNLPLSETLSAKDGVGADWLSNGVRVKGPGVLGSGAEALVWAKKAAGYKSTVFISPGAKIPPAAMSGLAESLASTGRIVFVMRYLNNLPIIPGQAAQIGALADLFKNQPEKLNGLDPALVKVDKSSMSFSIVGHSLGGAVLGDYIEKPNSLFSHVALYGVNSFAKDPKQVSVKLGLFIGSKDGLMIGDQEAKDKVLKVETLLGTKRTDLEDLNHFCIISDSTVGDTDKKDKDLPGLSSEACITVLSETLDTFLR